MEYTAGAQHVLAEPTRLHSYQEGRQGGLAAKALLEASAASQGLCPTPAPAPRAVLSPSVPTPSVGTGFGAFVEGGWGTVRPGGGPAPPVGTSGDLQMRFGPASTRGGAGLGVCIHAPPRCADKPTGIQTLVLSTETLACFSSRTARHI